MRYIFLNVFIFSLLFMPVTASAEIKDDVYIILNKLRLEQGRSPLEVSPLLMQAAQNHANDMRLKNYFSHTGLDGSNHALRIKRAGYKACYMAENIAKGQKTAQKVMEEWMESEGHRRNILSGKAEEFGVAKVDNIWVMVFARGC